MMAISGIELMIIQTIMFVIMLAFAGFIIYWMIKMLKNSSENLRLNREILDKLNNKNSEK